MKIVKPRKKKEIKVPQGTKILPKSVAEGARFSNDGKMLIGNHEGKPHVLGYLDKAFDIHTIKWLVVFEV